MRVEQYGEHRAAGVRERLREQPQAEPALVETVQIGAVEASVGDLHPELALEPGRVARAGNEHLERCAGNSAPVRGNQVGAVNKRLRPLEAGVRRPRGASRAS